MVGAAKSRFRRIVDKQGGFCELTTHGDHDMTGARGILGTVTCLSVLITSCDTDVRDYETAQRTNTIAAYDQFLARHPKSKIASQATKQLSELLSRLSYRFASALKDSVGAHKVSVVSTARGQEVRAGPMTFLRKPGKGKELELTPRDSRFNYSIGEIQYDPESFGFVSTVGITLKNGAILPARLHFLSGEGGLREQRFSAVYPDAANSSEIDIVIDPVIRSTAYAGLRFLTRTVAAINKDGRVEVDRDGITAKDSLGATFISRSLGANGSRPFVLVKQ
jgi:hypothetical protein